MNFWKGLTFKKKTWLALGSVFLITTLSMVYSIYTIREISKSYEHEVNGDIKFKDDLRILNSDLLKVRRLEREYFVTGKKEILKTISTDSAKIKEQISKLQESQVLNVSSGSFEELSKGFVNYSVIFTNIVKNIDEEGDSKTGIRGALRSTAHNIEKIIQKDNLNNQFMVYLLTLRRHEKDFLLRRADKYLTSVKKRVEEIQALSKALVKEQAVQDRLNKECKSYETQFVDLVAHYKNRVALESELDAAYANIESLINGIVNVVSENVEKVKNEQELRKQKVIITVLISSAISILLLIIVIYFYLSSSSRIEEYIEALKKDATSSGENSKKLESIADELSSGVNEQSAAILETVSTLDEIKEMMRKSLDNINFSDERASESEKVAKEGKKSVVNVLTSINEISQCNEDITNQMNTVSTELNEIVEAIKNISVKTEVINDIVFQTKLLSFNASVEAARAGEHGKGFAVVAEEVGNLATMSGKAAGEIEQLIAGSVEKVEQIVNQSKSRVANLVEVSKSKTSEGVDRAKECDMVLDSLVKNVSEVKALLSGVTEAAREQSTGVDNISQAMNELDAATHVNTHASNQTAGFASEAAKQADNLNTIVGSLENIILGYDKNRKVSDHHKVKNEKLENDNDRNSDSSAELEKKSNDSDTKESQDQADNFVSNTSQSFTAQIPSADDERFEDI